MFVLFKFQRTVSTWMLQSVVIKTRECVTCFRLINWTWCCTSLIPRSTTKKEQDVDIRIKRFSWNLFSELSILHLNVVARYCLARETCITSWKLVFPVPFWPSKTKYTFSVKFTLSGDSVVRSTVMEAFLFSFQPLEYWTLKSHSVERVKENFANNGECTSSCAPIVFR